MSTPWDVRTAVQEATLPLTGSSVEDTYWTNDLVWSPDGTKLIALNDSSSWDQSSIRIFNVTTAYDISTKNSEVTYTIEGHSNVTVDHPLGFEFNPAGTKMIVGGFHSYASNQQAYQRIQEFDLAGSYDFSTITKLSATSYNTFEYGGDDAIDEVIWKADGTKFITLNLNGDIHMYSVNVPFELAASTVTADGFVMNLGELRANQWYYNNSFEGLHFNPSQNRLYYIQNRDDGAMIGSMPFSW
jgi:WD40 repeat protein